MANRKALVTIAIGDAYVGPWRSYCYPGWKTYADTHGYDIVLIQGLLDSSPLGLSRSPSWQRLLICQHPDIQKYEDVVWLDADIVVNSQTAPCIVETSRNLAQTERTIGVVLDPSDGEPDPAIKNAVNRRQTKNSQTLNQGRTFRDMYRLNGFSEHDAGFNAGVMVLKPKVHAELLLDVYKNYQQTSHSWLEAVPLAHHVLSNGAAHGIPKSFNVNAARIFYTHYPFLLSTDKVGGNLMKEVVATMQDNSYFLHFLGGGVVRAAMQFTSS